MYSQTWAENEENEQGCQKEHNKVDIIDGLLY
jgi:hypothetical protein